MSIFNFIENEWERIKDDTHFSGYRWERISDFKGLIPTNQFWKDLKLRKSQRGFKCSCCDKELPKGTKYIGSTYEKICFCCFTEWIKNSNKTLLNIQERFKEIKEELNTNKDRWERELIINNLSS